MWIVRRSRATRPAQLPRPGAMGFRSWNAPQLRGDVVRSDDSEKLTVEAEDERAVGIAQPDGVLGQRLEDRGGDRNGDRPITLSSSLVAVCCSSDSVSSAFRVLQLPEQADVLDRDDGLVGEGLEERDLPVRERPRPRCGVTLITPMACPSRSSGTAMCVRRPSRRERARLPGSRDRSRVVDVNDASRRGSLVRRRSRRISADRENES